MPSRRLEVLLVDELDLDDDDLYPLRLYRVCRLFHSTAALDIPNSRTPPFLSQPCLDQSKGQETDHVFGRFARTTFSSIILTKRSIRSLNSCGMRRTIRRFLRSDDALPHGYEPPDRQDSGTCRADRKASAVLMELKARFDEEANFSGPGAWLRPGPHVNLCLVGLKTHCKCALVVRRGGEHLRR